MRLHSDEENVSGLCLTREPRDPCWELHPLAPGLGSVSLLGWFLKAPLLDAGVPEVAARVISRALCHDRSVTFIDPSFSQHSRLRGSAWEPVVGGQITILAPHRSLSLGKSPAFPLMCTNRKDAALKLFFTDYFDWSLRTQVAVLSRANASPPALTYQHVSDLLDRRPIDLADFVRETQALGVMLPGVDGDFAEFLVPDDALRDELEAQLAQECQLASLTWQVVSESEFKEMTSALHQTTNAANDDKRRRHPEHS